jgi:hypothetical protein
MYLAPKYEHILLLYYKTSFMQINQVNIKILIIDTCHEMVKLHC